MKSGFGLGKVTLVLEDHVRDETFIQPGRGFLKHLQHFSGMVEY